MSLGSKKICRKADIKLPGVFNQSGLSLVSVVVAMGLSGILISVIGTMFQMQANEMKALQQMLARSNLNQRIISALQNPTTCGCQLDGNQNTAIQGRLRVDTTKSRPQTIRLDTFRSDCRFSNPSNIIAQSGQTVDQESSLLVSGVEIDQILPTGTPNQYTGRVRVNFDQDNLVRPLNPVVVDVSFAVDPGSGSANSRPIASCAGQGGEVYCTALGGTMVSGRCVLLGASDIEARKWQGPDGDAHTIRYTPCRTGWTTLTRWSISSYDNWSTVNLCIRNN